MLERVEQKGEKLARERAAARRERIAAALGALPGVTAEPEREVVTLSGRRLAWRYERSARLRWAISEVCDER